MVILFLMVQTYTGDEGLRKKLYEMAVSVCETGFLVRNETAEAGSRRDINVQQSMFNAQFSSLTAQ